LLGDHRHATVIVSLAMAAVEAFQIQTASQKSRTPVTPLIFSNAPSAFRFVLLECCVATEASRSRLVGLGSPTTGSAEDEDDIMTKEIRHKVTLPAPPAAVARSISSGRGPNPA
jgi:hypothetical protein